ncbi:MAG: polysaccharide pyruvyl transferase family protein [Candidatus Cloacimonetes bacterium]|nr:polysaccharide pyruvyl transferase family protein [Candidatus Cloacimonadota bacterium]
MTVCLMNVGFGGNKGAEAMLVTMLQQLHQRFPGIRLAIERPAREHPGYYRERITELREAGMNLCWIDFHPAWRMASPLKAYSDEQGAQVSPDAVIDLGGLNFQDRSQRGSLRTVIRHLPFVSRGIPLFFFTQDMGPMEYWFTRFCARLLLRRARRIFTRSARTHELLARGVPLRNLPLAGPFADSTFALQSHVASAPTHTDNLPLLVISPSQVVERLNPQSYRLLLEMLLKELIPHYRVLLLAHTFAPGDTKDDADLCRELHRDFPTCLLGDENLPVEILKGRIGAARLVVSSRFHVLVAALGQGVPVVALGWNPKYGSLLGSFGIEFANVTDTAPEQCGKIVELLGTLDAPNIRATVARHAERARTEAMASFDMLEQELRSIHVR